MGWRILRYQIRERIHWGVVCNERVVPLPGTYATLADFLADGGAEQARAGGHDPSSAASLPLTSVEPLSPITIPCRIIGQGTNYQSHRQEAKLHPTFNLLFAKADSSLAPAHGPVVRPPGVELLDYELELGLVVGRAITGPIHVRAEHLAEVVAGLVIANDISARDVQIPEEQWFRGKSFRTFCPVGPYFYLLDESDAQHLGDLRLRLWVNGQLRQDSFVNQLIHGPAATLELLSTVLDLAPGDLLLTGTPGGVALRAPSGIAQRVGSLLPPKRRMQAFLASQRKRSAYLHDGDVVSSTIATADGSIDLGEQQWQVVPASSDQSVADGSTHSAGVSQREGMAYERQ